MFQFNIQTFDSAACYVSHSLCRPAWNWQQNHCTVQLFKYLNLKTSGLCVKLPIQGCTTLKYSAWPIHTGTWEALTVSCPPRCYSASWTAYFHVGPVLSSNKSFSRPGHPNQKPHQHRSYQRFAKFRLPFYGTMISAVRKARVFKKATCKRKDHCHDHEVRTERSGEWVYRNPLRWIFLHCCSFIYGLVTPTYLQVVLAMWIVPAQPKH